MVDTPRRSIQDIIPPARSKPVRTPLAPKPPSAPSRESTKSTPPPPQPPPPSTPVMKRERKPLPLPALIIGGVGFVLVATFFIVTTFFYRADVVVTLARFTVSVAETFEAAPEGVLLSFTTREAEEVATKTVPRTGSEYVEDHAEGSITIYNEASTKSQRLITNTRFETPAGLTYRIKSPVVVPGYTTSGGKKVPGEVNVVVYADEAGEKYNGPATTFTLPGLKGSAQYEGTYAKSTTALSGGFIGERATVDEAVRDEALVALKQEAGEKARLALNSAVTSAEVLFADTVTVSFVEEPDKASNDGAVITVRAIARGPVFDEHKLAAVIASEGAVSFSGPMSIESPERLVVAVEPSTTPEQVRVTISGEASLVGEYDQERFRQDLAGKDRRAVGVVLSGYPAITDAKISVYPFWRGSLPKDVGRIKVVEEAPQSGE